MDTEPDLNLLYQLLEVMLYLSLNNEVILCLSLNNDVMTTSKLCVKLFSLIFFLNCLTKFIRKLTLSVLTKIYTAKRILWCFSKHFVVDCKLIPL